MNTPQAATGAAEGPRPPSGRPEKLRLGDVLVQQRLISQEQLLQTLELQRTTGKKVGIVRSRTILLLGQDDIGSADQVLPG